MNKIIIFFTVLLFAGVGCANAPAPQSQIPTSEVNLNPSDVSVTAPPTDNIANAAIPPATEATALDITIVDGNFFFEPKTITASPGQTINITIASNEGTHTFVVDNVIKRVTTTGEKFSFNAPMTPGNYSYYCDVGSHQQRGMEGVLTVK